MAGFVTTAHLIGCHPKLAASNEFRSWLRRYGAEVWHETHASEDGRLTVVVQSLDRLHIFAALLQRIPGEVEPDDFMTDVLRTTEITINDGRLTSDHAALIIMSERGARSEEIQAVRPVVDLDEETSKLSWEVELVKSNQLEKFRLDEKTIIKLKADVLNLPGLAEVHRMISHPSSRTSDWLGENELHQPRLFREEALGWLAGEMTVSEKADLIRRKVRSTYVFDSNIRLITEFTFADYLVRDLLNRGGVCDEWAVVTVSYLRSLGIQAAIKFLNYTFGGKVVAHACVEFFDGTRWVHLDPMYRAFDQPSIYRDIGATSVTVMDADFPRDSRSTIPAWGAPDPSGDGRLNPYLDFLITPPFPGDARPGYSF